MTLVGPGGIGKTRLALELGKLSAKQFKDGVAFADLSPIDNPALLASTVAASVGIREQARAPLVRVLAEGLRTRHLLLIVDNCEHLVRDCAALAQQLLSECPALAILATSREPLAVPGELVWQVAALELPDPLTSRSPEALVEHAAAELFVERVQAAAPDFVLDDVSAPIVADIVRRLDGIPLALELAATRVRSLGIVKLADRLDERLRLLVGGTSAPVRQQTLRATLDWSYELLGSPERHLFVGLAPFAGDWRLEDAEAICATDELPAEQVVERLAKLVDQSLVVVQQPSGETRYRLLDTMRHYAADRLNEYGLAESACTRHRDHYLAEAEREPAERYTIAHIEWLSREADNLRAALRWSIDRDDFAVAFRLAAALLGLWYVRGWLSEGRAWLNELLDRAGSAIESMQGARTIGGAARLAYVQGDLASAASMAERCWQLAHRFADDRGLSLAATRRALVARGQGDLERARALSEEALKRARAGADIDLQVFSLYGLSVTLLGLQDLEHAAELAAECLALAESVGHAWGISSAHRVLGLAEQRSPRVAREHLEESLAWSSRLGYAQGTVYATLGLGRLALAEGNAPAADAHLREALKLAHELGDQLEVVHCLDGLAQTRETESGVSIAAAAQAMRETLGAPPFASEQAGLAEWLETARRTLGDTHYAELWAEGRLTDPRKVVAELLAATSTS